MDLARAKQDFVDAWGRLGTEWGINRSMARIHALLLVAHEPLDVEAIQERLALSRGNASTNLRALVDWGLAQREHRPGVRREFFRAEKDLWEVARRIVEQRRRRELDPLLAEVARLASVRPRKGEDAAEAAEFQRVLGGIAELGGRAGRLLDLALALDQVRFFRSIVRLVPGGAREDRR